MSKRQLNVAPATVYADRREDGTLILTNGIALPTIEGTLPARLRHWATVTPQALFLSEGETLLRYGEAEQRRRALAARLLALAITRERTLMIVGSNGLNHALMMLAATSVGLPVAVISPAYVAPDVAPWSKFVDAYQRIDPAMVVADDPGAVAAALGTERAAQVRPLRDLNWAENVEPAPADAVDAAEASVNLDSVAKLLLTSGSTGRPKIVINTQRMMVSNMLGLAQVWPFLAERPPVSVDWLPWNHTFGGNCCFNITLWFGGHSHIDEGRPSPKLIGRSKAALERWMPTLYYNVPVGFDALIPCLEADVAFARNFFERLDFLFNGGAPMSDALRRRLEAVALSTTGRVPSIVAGWGATETAPFSTVLFFDQPHAANLGVPIPGTAIKLVPNGGRLELRVRGPNVTPGYWGDRIATDAAFDEEGFYRIGDAARLVDPENPSAGLLFDGRVAENFKLSTGTWVGVGSLRLAVLSACKGLASDVVVTGEGRSDLGLLVFASEPACRAALGEVDPASEAGRAAVRALLAALLAEYNRWQTGSSTRIARLLIAEEPLSAAHDEITDKGYVNQRRVLDRRADLVERLYRDEHRI